MRYKLVAVTPDRHVLITSFKDADCAKMVAQFLDKELSGPVMVVVDDSDLEDHLVWPA